MHASERERPDVVAARQEHVEQVCTRPDVARFHFLDETGLRLDYVRTHAQAVSRACRMSAQLSSPAT